MALPILGTVVAKRLGEKLAWRLLKWSMWLAAKAFRDQYKPIEHAVKSRYWFWDHVWLPIINRAKLTENIFDDPAGEYLYYAQACYIEDGTLPELLRGAQASIARGEPGMATQQVGDALRLIGALPAKP